jgi:Carboxypeptidase regulatory-like domain
VPRSRFFLLSLLAAALWAGLAIPAASAVPVALAAPARLAMHASQAGAAVAPGPATPAVPGLRAASLAGTVLGASGQPVAHACVAATSSGAAFPALTDAAGRYRFTLPAPGTYTLTFSGCAAGRYRTEWSGGSLTAAGARPVRLTAGASVVVSPVHLESLSAQTAMPGPAGSLAAARATGAIVRAPAATASPPGISGVVRNAAGHKLAGVCVQLTQQSESSTSGGIVASEQYSEETWTGRDGRYSSGPIPPGRWQVMFESGCPSSAGNYAPQWWRGRPTARHATWVRVGQHTRDASISATMSRGAAISGILTSAVAPHAPLSGFCVELQGAGSLAQIGGQATTSSTGRYRFTNLGTGRYQLQAYPCGATASQNLVPAERYASARVGRTTQAANFELQPGAVISGTVTGTSPAGADLGGICVVAVPDSLAAIHQGALWAAETAADGSYSIPQLPAGRYYLAFRNCDNGGSFADDYYDGSPAGTESSAGARPVTLATAQLATADVQLQPGATITGSVTTTSGTRLSGVCVSVVAPAATARGFQFPDSVAGDLYSLGSFASTAATRTGSYRLGNLTPGTYLAQFDTPAQRFFSCGNRGNYAWQWFRGKAAFGQAQEISAGPGTTSGIGAVLAPGGTIAGRITNRSGRPVRGICVLVSGADGLTEDSPVQLPAPVSGKSGTYQVTDLPAGRYAVTFSPGCDDISGYSPAAYRNGRTIRVRFGKVSAAANVVLAPAGSGSISGQVRSGVTGRPAAGWCVLAYSASGLPAEGSTNARGRYRIGSLAPGRYRVQIVPCLPAGASLAPQERSDVRVAGDAAARLNVRLRAGGQVSGTVTAGAAPAPGVCVEATPLSGTGQPAVAVTGAAGTYALTGLAGGNYQLRFTADCPQGSGPLAPSAARSITVRPGRPAADVNATLQAVGAIAGTVTGPASAGLSGICVAAYPLRGGPTVVAVSTNGGYRIGGLAPGGYRIEFSAGCGATGFVSQWWQAAGSAGRGKPVTVLAGGTTTGIDAQLVTG